MDFNSNTNHANRDLGSFESKISRCNSGRSKFNRKLSKFNRSRSRSDVIRLTYVLVSPIVISRIVIVILLISEPL